MKQLTLLSLVLVLLMLAGCQVVAVDPLGATTREGIRADALVRAAELEAEAQRRIAEAQADAQKHAAMQETVRTGIVAAMVPWALLIVGVVVVVCIIVNWQGRIHYARAGLEQRPSLGLPTPAAKPQPRPAGQALSLPELKALAESHGYDVEIEGRVVYLLVDGQRVGRRLLA